MWHDFQKFNLEKYLKDLDARTAEDEYDLGRVEQEFSVIPVWHMQEDPVPAKWCSVVEVGKADVSSPLIFS